MNRQAEIDRRKVEIDYRINIKAQLEIEQLHQKIDQGTCGIVATRIHVVAESY